LAERFLESLNASAGTAKRLSAAALERIQAYPWPGNVRELRNQLNRAFIMSGNEIELGDFDAEAAPETAALPDGARRPPDMGATLDDAERQHIIATLAHCDGDKKKAAQILGISLKTLYNRLRQYTPS
jgi:DNA-binding NtrC family response regulator